MNVSSSRPLFVFSASANHCMKLHRLFTPTPQFSAKNVERYPQFGDRTDTLIIALHGGGQSLDDPIWNYLDFLEMSQLNLLAGTARTVVMPRASMRTWAIYRQRDVEVLREIIRGETPAGQDKPKRLIGCGFSLGATFLLHAARYIPFDGLVVCSGILPPALPWQSPPAVGSASPGGVDSLVWIGAKEPEDWAWWRPFRATAEGAEEIHAELSVLGRSKYEVHPQGHRWPADWNFKIRDYFDL